MGLEINAISSYMGVQPNFFLNPIRQNNNIPKFTGSGINRDVVSTNHEFVKYFNEAAIQDMVNSNPEIARILKDSGMPVKINMKTMNDLLKNHLPDTKKIAAGIMLYLPIDFMQSTDRKTVLDAAMLHDIGKILIPDKVLNKKGGLNEKELEIMHKHSVLSYEMLKTTNLDSKTLLLIKNHHQNAQNTGYPKSNGLFVSDINLQILEAADMYSALREKRPYKKELTKNQALSIIHSEMKEGKIHPAVFKALVNWANAAECGTKDRAKLLVLNPEREIPDNKPVNRLSA